MAKIHVFDIDWVPARTDIASGGGLRSLQIIEALRDAGHTVTDSIPSSCRHIRRVGIKSETLRNIDIHTHDNQIDLLKRLRPDVVLWLAPLSRQIPFTGTGDIVQICDLVGLPHIEASMGAKGLEVHMRDRLGRLCNTADLVLTGSEEQNGYWLCELSRDRPPPPSMIVPYAVPASLRSEGATGAAPLRRLHVTGMVYAWSTSTRLLERAADWVASHNGITLSAIVGTDPGGATDRSILERLAKLANRPNVEMPGEVSFGTAMADYAAGSLTLDLYEPNMERRMAVPIRTVNSLAHGVPVLTTIDSTMMRRVQAEGGGIIASDSAEHPIEKVLERVAAMPASELEAMSIAARRFADREYRAEASAEALVTAVATAIDRRAARTRAMVAGFRPEPEGGSTGKPPHVLVISNVEAHHRELRVDIPFNTLVGEQSISGYTVWSKGDFRFSTSSNLSEQNFDAIWVQRLISPEIALALKALDRPFVYDLDDNLLAAPGYREPFPVELMQTVRNLIWSCTVLSTSTGRLGQYLQSATASDVVEKTIVTQNLMREAPLPRTVGKPRALIWVSSDTPALLGSRNDVIRAIRDFCLSFGLKLICIGAEAPDMIQESDVEITHIRSAPYGSYLSVLRSFAPAIIACPLEIDPGGSSSEFINGKSDIKILETLASGLTGVFSRARPYSESDLPPQIMCDNSYQGWMEALRDAFNRSSEPDAAIPFPLTRFASVIGTQPHLEAIERVRLTQPVSCLEFKQTLTQWRGRYGRRLLSAAEFDEEFYINQYADVRGAINDGVVGSAYEHYRQDGFREGRQGCLGDVFEAQNENVWTNLVHTLGDLKSTVGHQARYLETLKARRATRLTMKRRPGG